MVHGDGRSAIRQRRHVVRAASVALGCLLIAACSTSTEVEITPAATSEPPATAETTGETTAAGEASGEASGETEALDTSGADTPEPSAGCDDPDEVKLRDRVYRSVPGADPALLSLDVFGPQMPSGCPPSPIVIYLHGGSFQFGDKAQQIDDKIAYFTDAGYLFVTANYRLVGNAKSGADGAVYPAQAEDIAAVVAWVVDNAPRFGADPDRIALVGHSSGGFLAAQQATDPRYLTAAGVDPAVPRCVVVLDTAGLDVAAEIEVADDQSDVYLATFGDDPDVWRVASPQTGANEGTVTADFLLVTRGRQQRVETIEWFAATLKLAGVKATTVKVDPLDHAGVNAALGASDDDLVTPPVGAFLTRCLG